MEKTDRIFKPLTKGISHFWSCEKKNFAELVCSFRIDNKATHFFELNMN